MSVPLLPGPAAEAWKKRAGFWTDHEYKRSTVSDIESFIGWPFMTALVQDTDEDTAELSATLFETGGRISEALALKPSHFEDRGDFILVKEMPVFKRKKTAIAPTRFRNFPIRKAEPLVTLLRARIERVQKPEDLLFASTYKKRAGHAITPTRAYQLVHAQGHRHGIHIFPHWFRAERACQLASDYGFQLHDLMEFFKWKNIGTALHYSRLGWEDLARRMTLTPGGQGPGISVEQLSQIIKMLKSGEV